MQYEVLTPLKRNGKLYRPGELVELPPEEAETMPRTVRAAPSEQAETALETDKIVSRSPARTRRSK